MTRVASAGIAIAIGTLVFAGACGDVHDHPVDTGPRGPAATTDVMPSDTDHHDHARPSLGIYDPAHVAAFVATFRARYPELAVDRNDAEIAGIATQSCDDLGNHVDPDAVSSRIVDRAEHEGRMPTGEQSREIYGLVETVCR